MTPEANRYVTRHELVSRFGITFSNTHLLYLESIGAFPERIAISARRKVWDEAEVIAFIEHCKHQRGES